MKFLLLIYCLFFSYSCLAQRTIDDKLKITSSGKTVQPLLQQQLPADGSSGLAYQKNLVQKSGDQKEEGQTTTRRLRAIEREYSLSGSTFDKKLQKQIEVPTKASFQVQTMGEAAKAVKKENIRFEECKGEEKNCIDYKVDESGKVIW